MQLRFKEFGIRKVMGADQFNIVKLANKEYLWIMILAFGLGAPMGVTIIQSFAESRWSVSKPLTPWPIFMALLIAFLSIALTVYHQIRKASQVNPVEVLRDE